VQTVPERAGPAAGEDVSSRVWLYHSHADEIGDTYAGLQGPLVVTRAGGADADGRRRVTICFGMRLHHLRLYVGEACSRLHCWHGNCRCNALPHSTSATI
jgi:hypothetical protein